MLNELAILRRSLDRYNVPDSGTHPWVKRLGRSETLILGLDGSAQVQSVELRDPDEAMSLFKVQENYHSNFPGINLDAPICRLDPKAASTLTWLETPEADIYRRAQALRKACEGAPLNPKAAGNVRLARKVCGGLKDSFAGAEPQFAAFSALMERLLAMAAPEEEWVRGLVDAALRAAEQGTPALLRRVELLLAGKYDKKTKIFKDAKLPIPAFLDVAEYAAFACRVADPRMGGYFSRRLFAAEVTGGVTGTCSLTGSEVELETDKLPSPVLPLLGPTVLMSMNRQTPCQHRYGRIGTEVFPIGKRIAAGLSSALVQLTVPGREFKNWQRVPARVDGKANLLLTYLEGDPLQDADWASLFSEPEEAEEQYSEICEKLARAMAGRDSHGSDRLQVLVLNKIDPGRVQVELSESFTAAQVLAGGREWAMAASDVPPLVLRREPEVPFPSDVLRASQRIWIRGGREFADAPGCALGQVYDLLIADRPEAQNSARALLHLFVGRAMPLLAAAGLACHRKGGEAWKGFSKEAKRSASTSVATLAIALHKLGREKEKYMQGPAYQLGRFLSLVDTLHREYCVKVRDGQIPPQLLGNALLPTAVASPKKGLSHMLNRIRVYQAWAVKSGSGLARWTLGEIGTLTPVLAEGLPEHMDDAARAELLLGYLARSEKKQEGTSEEGGDENAERQQ